LPSNHPTPPMFTNRTRAKARAAAARDAATYDPDRDGAYAPRPPIQWPHEGAGHLASQFRNYHKPHPGGFYGSDLGHLPRGRHDENIARLNRFLRNNQDGDYDPFVDAPGGFIASGRGRPQPPRF